MKPGLWCTAGLEPVRELPVCVHSGGAWASQVASFLGYGSGTSLALWVEPMCQAASLDLAGHGSPDPPPLWLIQGLMAGPAESKP